jgi:LPXTG-motif cell wall-anchored protein
MRMQIQPPMDPTLKLGLVIGGVALLGGALYLVFRKKKG